MGRGTFNTSNQIRVARNMCWNSYQSSWLPTSVPMTTFGGGRVGVAWLSKLVDFSFDAALSTAEARQE